MKSKKIFTSLLILGFTIGVFSQSGEAIFAEETKEDVDIKEQKTTVEDDELSSFVEVGLLHSEFDSLAEEVELESVYGDKLQLSAEFEDYIIPIETLDDNITIEKNEKFKIDNKKLKPLENSIQLKLGPFNSKNILEKIEAEISDDYVYNTEEGKNSYFLNLIVDETEIDDINSIIEDTLEMQGFKFHSDYLAILKVDEDKRNLEEKKGDLKVKDVYITSFSKDEWAIYAPLSDYTDGFHLFKDYDLSSCDFDIIGPGYFVNNDDELITYQKSGSYSIAFQGDFDYISLKSLKEDLSEVLLKDTNYVYDNLPGVVMDSFQTKDEAEDTLDFIKELDVLKGIENISEISVIDTQDMNKFEKSYLGDKEIERLAINSKYDKPIKLLNNKKSYRGKLTITNKDEGLMVTNILSLEDYLKGVVPAEAYASWNKEALKAQAVASRTYAMFTKGNRYSEFDLCDTQFTQVYNGYGHETERTNEAVKETRGEKIYFNDRLINALYHSNSGGVTEDSENVWGSDVAYLRSVESPWDESAVDRGSSYSYKWEREYNRNELSEIVDDSYGIGDLKEIEITEKTEAGRIKYLTYKGEDSEHEVFGDSIRSPLGLKSTMFKIDSNRDETELNIKSADGSMTYKETKDEELYAITGETNEPRKVKEESLHIKGQKGTKEIQRVLMYYLYGNGFGHGLGMSQWGAHGMAEDGYNYKEILNHYYTDQVEIK
ncbi:SpoIID/LytB domain-containing protein [Natranaerobius trueperi]|uniref:Sporulation stage II protein D amidase enhancer LytB N-terminal domain-containing protein n=1 Tax=Natranaerobius trueperi TaxID=759412 RepID=A0A226BWN5_9FIRM|nr:SpoIID/LytB domain-containing protein [Natranaerobius trueperi]OWZ83448.1 hypothetical protein CDO51_08650 [Natranaerobius trueperi]